MNNISKLILSDEEQEMVNNTAWILTKRKIMEQVNQLMGYLCEHQQAVVENEKEWLPTAVVQSTPKIAKGENYLQLPYVLLDYPRCFDETNIFVVRTMFWWGNFFSITLQLSGRYKEKFQQKIIENVFTSKAGFFIGINESQWHHHFEDDNYIPVKQLNKNVITDIIHKKQFIKLAIKFPLQPWAAIPALLDKSFLEIIKLLKD